MGDDGTDQALMAQRLGPGGLFDLAGHVAFVTGAASGLGLAFSEVLAEYGAHVVMTDVDGDGLAREAGRIAATGAKLERIVLDAGDPVRVNAVMDEIVARHRRLDSLFANVAASSGSGFGFGESGRIENLDVEGWERVLRVNLTGAVLAMKHVVPHMARQGGGRIVITSSIAGIRAEPLVGYAYAATKAAISNVVRQAAAELAARNILVNAIAPGPFMTNIGGGRLHRQPEVVARFAEAIPLGRLGRPDEIKGLALLLASPAGSFITGAVIPVDGGATAVTGWRPEFGTSA
jgi:NAD(P)-dependent dehydrogenase (short-subunit alcohol dehydrogenase family)